MNDDTVQEQNRGWFFPVTVVRMLQKGTIKKSEFVLLGVINSLVHETKGCWATNGYLAKMTGSSSVRVRHVISRLKHMGLLKVLLRKNTDEGWKRKMWVIYPRDPMVGNDHTPMVGNDHTPMVGNDHILKRAAHERCAANAAAPSYAGSSLLNAAHERNGSLSKAERLVSLFCDLSSEEKLYLLPTGRPVKGATRTGWHVKTIAVWKRIARELIRSRGWKEVMRVWIWWKNHRRDKYVPNAATFRQFAEKFDSIEQAQSRIVKEAAVVKSKLVCVRSKDGQYEWHVSRRKAHRLVEKGIGVIVEEGS